MLCFCVRISSNEGICLNSFNRLFLSEKEKLLKTFRSTGNKRFAVFKTNSLAAGTAILGVMNNFYNGKYNRRRVKP